jgi:tetratricopeptide (TPR) repeat protein
MLLHCFRSSTMLTVLLVASIPNLAIAHTSPKSQLLPQRNPYLSPPVPVAAASNRASFTTFDISSGAVLTASAGPIYINAEGGTLWQQGQLAAALAKFEAALAQYQTAGDRWGETQSYLALGIVNHDWGQYALALEQLETSLSLFHTDSDRGGAAEALNGLGLVHRSQGNYPAANDYFQQSLTLHQEMSNRIGAATVLHNLADVRLKQSDYSAATAYTNSVLRSYT